MALTLKFAFAFVYIRDNRPDPFITFKFCSNLPIIYYQEEEKQLKTAKKAIICVLIDEKFL